ncbi:MAG: 30S ribosomal protein S9, partial [Bacteroidetes bacterium]|nr:30S ribosomal protein S9 [Bacteroidota bacterium]
MSYITTIGRRKTSVARIYLKAGSGNISVNGRALDTYFPTTSMQMIVNQPMELTETAGQFDVKVNVYGGGFKGQAEAIRLGLS